MNPIVRTAQEHQMFEQSCQPAAGCSLQHGLFVVVNFKKAKWYKLYFKTTTQLGFMTLAEDVRIAPHH